MGQRITTLQPERAKEKDERVISNRFLCPIPDSFCRVQRKDHGVSGNASRVTREQCHILVYRDALDDVCLGSRMGTIGGFLR